MAPRRLQVAEREEYLAHINRLRRQASDALLIFDAEMRATTDVTAQLTALQNLLQAVGAEQRLQKWRTDAQEAGRLAEAQEHDQVYQDVQDLLAQAASFLGKGQLTLTALTEILDSGFASLTARLIPPALDEVFVADLQRSRTPAVKVSFLIGVNERVFPAAITDDGFFTSTEREALKEVGWELAPSSRQRQLAEEYLVYIALSRSSEQLYISHALSGEQGENLLPSPVLRRLRRIFPDLRYQNIPRQPGLQNSEEYIGGRLDTLNQLARQLRQAADGMPIADCWWQAYDWFARQPKWQNQLTRLCRGVVWQPDEQPIDATLTSSLYGKKHVTSISRLEAFNRCPCRYFARYGLKLRPPRQFVLEKLDMGAFYHLLLSEASLWIQDAGYDWSALTAEQLDSVLEQVLEKVKEEEIMELLRSSSRYLYSLKQGVAIVKATLLAMSEQAKLGDFRPVAFEVGFGPKEKWPGWQLQLPDGETLILEGRIDRIDIAQENGETHQFWLRVVDFKSSNKDLLPEEIAHGISLQLPVYLKVALDNAQDFAEGAPKPAGMFYMTVQDKMKNEGSPYTGPGEIRLNGLPILEKNSVLLAERDLQGRAQTIPVSLKADGSFGAGKGIHLEECEKLTEEVAACIRQTVSRIQAGEVHAQPWQSSAGSACDYCDYASLCAMDRIKGGDHHE